MSKMMLCFQMIKVIAIRREMGIPSPLITLVAKRAEKSKSKQRDACAKLAHQ